MAQSLLDLGPIIQLAQMGMQMERLDLARQQEARQVKRDAIQQEQFDRRQAFEEQQHKLEQRKADQTAAFRGFDEMEKIKAHPSMATNRERQIDILMAQGSLMERGLGVKVPLPDRDELRGGFESVDKFIKVMRTGTDEEKFNATADMLASNPKYGMQVLDDMKKAGDVSMQMESLQSKLALNKAQLEALNVRTGRAKMAENFFTEHSGALGRVALLPMEKEFAEPYRKVISFTGDNVQQAREIFLQQNPILKSEFEKRLLSERPAVEATVQRLEEAIDVKWAAMREYQAANGQAPQELVDELSALEAAYKARRTELDYIDNPYDKETYKSLQKMHQDLKIRQSAAGKQIGEIANERTALMSRKYEDKQVMDQNIAKAQQEFAAQGDYSPKAASVFAQKHGVKVQDVMEGIKDPNKPLVNVAMNQEKAESKEVGENYGKQFAELEKSSFASVSKLAKYDRMEQLLNQVTTGALQPTKQKVQELAEGFGLKVDPSLPAAQALESLTNEMTLELRNPSGGAGMPGAMSDKDREFLAAMSPNLSRTKEGNALIIETAKQLAKRNMEVAKMARAYRKEHGTFDGGFYDELADWAEKHPLFDGKKVPGGNKLGALGNTIIGTTDEGRPIVKNPDGSVSTERTTTVEIDGKWVNIPTMFGGKQVSDEEAVDIMTRNGMVDPETGRTMPTFDSREEAETAAKARSKELGKKYSGGPVQIQSDADYNKLPSGAIFIDPEGKRRRKP